MLEAMRKLIQDLELIPRGSTVLCAVSGGADSVCLLHALYQLRGKLGFRLAAAHYNHKLRGEESDRDAAFTAQFIRLCCGAQTFSDGACLPAVPLYAGSGEVEAEAERRGTGIEETAREMRYAFLWNAAREAGAAAIATAHTADDNVETVLFHLARGSGLRGLAGIRPNGKGLIRPLLTTTRREVEAYLTFYGLPHVEDRSNSDDTYTRNRIRHQVIPVLEEICPGFADRMASTAAMLRADEDYLSAQAGAISGQAVFRGESLTIPAALIGQAPDPLAVRAVRQLIGRVNGGDQNCTSLHLTAVLRLCRGDDPSAQAHLSCGLAARREYGELALTRLPPPAPFEARPLPLPGEVQLGDWRVSCSAQTYGGQPQEPFDFWLTCLPELTARPRQIGDQLKLAGRPAKTVKKWMIDEKIPKLSRDCLPVLTCGDKVAAVAGLGPAEEFLPQPGGAAWHFVLESRELAKQPYRQIT